MNKNKKWSVKAFNFVEVDQELNKNKKSKHFIRKLVLIAKDLTYQAAKNLCREYAYAGASIFPNVKSEELKVIKLS